MLRSEAFESGNSRYEISERELEFRSSDHQKTQTDLVTIAPQLAIALIGPGRVGREFLKRLGQQAPADWALEAVINSSEARLASRDSDCWTSDVGALEQRTSSDLDQLPTILSRRVAGAYVIIDATASCDVAARHAGWIDQGIHVLSANKLALAGSDSSWSSLLVASKHGQYHASATVGAGLPVLDSLGRLRAAGERIQRIRAVVSGSLSFFCDQLNANRAASSSLIEAHERGLTEPDPRTDLGGLDVARKLVIMARSAGFNIGLSDMEIQNLVPEALASVSLEDFFAQIKQLDQHGRDLIDSAPGQGDRVVYLAELETGQTPRVGLNRVPANDPMARLSGVDNRIEIYTDTYSNSPLVIAGPGAGVEVTALALWSDLRQISECATRGR